MNQSNKQTRQSAVVEVTRDELPMHCPSPDNELWNSHPRVFIPLEESPEASCSYCGTKYKLVEKKSST